MEVRGRALRGQEPGCEIEVGYFFQRARMLTRAAMDNRRSRRQIPETEDVRARRLPARGSRFPEWATAWLHRSACLACRRRG
jgi:hypothetical protein